MRFPRLCGALLLGGLFGLAMTIPAPAQDAAAAPMGSDAVAARIDPKELRLGLVK